MIKEQKFHDASLRFRDEGQGEVVVLLHGYLESLEIWNGFSEELAKHYRVLSIDLPGHGESGLFSKIDTMAVMADAVECILQQLGIYRTVIVGHSMGGYATMAFAEIFPEMTNGFCLFHSHAMADTDEKKQNRERNIKLVKQGKKTQIINTHISNSFADDNLKIFTDEVERVRKIAQATPEEGIIRALIGMKSRPDRRRVIKEASVPMLFIAGRKDNYIPFEVSEQHFNLSPRQDILILENSGHMGFIEEKAEVLEGLLFFLDKVYG
jgi:pimeloyl-ACP methyl ester carboxylesterase